MLLTLPWLGSLILGRVDIINGVGQDDTRSKFTSKSFFSQVNNTVMLEFSRYSKHILIIN